MVHSVAFSDSIEVHLDDVLHARRMTLTELSARVGVTMANLSILKTGKARAIRFSTLLALCRELHCQPGDLLRYQHHAGQPQPAPPQLHTLPQETHKPSDYI